MTAREFAIGVLQMLIVIAAIGGAAMFLEQLFEGREIRNFKALERAKRSWAKSLEKP